MSFLAALAIPVILLGVFLVGWFIVAPAVEKVADLWFALVSKSIEIRDSQSKAKSESVQAAA